MQGPMNGVRVLEVAQVWMAPAAAALLADWGADVIKVESPQGDSMRRETRSVVRQVAGANPLMEQCNRGKRSISLDIRTPEGLDLLYKLVDESDVFITNFLPQTCAKLGIDVDDIRARNPRVVYARGLGQGAHGPDKSRGGYDSTSWWARSGLCDLVTETDAVRPAQLPIALGDSVTALALAAGIAASLTGRAMSGIAQTVDVSLLASGMWAGAASTVVAAASAADTGMRVAPPRSPLMDSYRTQDLRWIMLSFVAAQWTELCERLERSDLIVDPRFANDALRFENAVACRAEIAMSFAKLTLEEVRARLAGATGVWTPIQTITEAMNDPQVVANQYISSLSYEGSDETIKVISSPVRFGDEQPELARGPRVGEHTLEILGQLGLSDSEIAKHIASGSAVDGKVA